MKHAPEHLVQETGQLLGFLQDLHRKHQRVEIDPGLMRAFQGDPAVVGNVVLELEMNDSWNSFGIGEKLFPTCSITGSLIRFIQ